MNACIVARFLGSVGTMVTCVGVSVKFDPGGAVGGSNGYRRAVGVAWSGGGALGVRWGYMLFSFAMSGALIVVLVEC